MIRELLEARNAYGAGRAILGKVLMEEAGLRTLREFYRQVEIERNEEALICANRSRPKGYYLAKDCEEVIEFYNRASAQPKTTLYNLRHFRTCMEEEQLELIRPQPLTEEEITVCADHVRKIIEGELT